MKANFIIIFLVSCIFPCNATIHQVGSNKPYTNPHELYTAGVVQDSDTIEIDAETYTGTDCLAVWYANNLLIKGVGGRPHLIADGQYIQGKGIWVLAGNGITVENIEFSGATVPDKNGAGIRLDGVGMTVRHCYFHDNENGILTSNPNTGDIIIEFSEFDHNGYGDGYSHNLYIGHVNKLIFRFNYSHHASIGHNLKSRANENYILYNRIMDEASGESSRLIDLPNGGFSIIMGNLLMQGNNAQNNNLFGYGQEGLTNSLSEFYFINNTMVNKRTASCIFVDIEAGTSVANITNNVFAGTGTVVNGTETAMSNNIIDPQIAKLFFADEVNYDYHLLSNSPAVDAGTFVGPVNGYSLTPDSAYKHSTDFSLRIVYNIIDAGAYEYNPVTSVSQPCSEKLSFYPNPFREKIIIENKILDVRDISIFNLTGQDLSHMISVHKCDNRTIIDTSELSEGLYLIKVGEQGKIIFKM